MTSKNLTSSHSKRPALLLAGAALEAIAVVMVAALFIFSFAHKAQAQATPQAAPASTELNDTTDDPAAFAKRYPLQYDGYRRTVDQQRTKYGGSEAMPRTPTQADPRSAIARSKLEQDPRLKTMWAGYAFSMDYRERRGHAYMLDDQTFSGRQKANPPAMCINCHASMVPYYTKLGDGDIMKGFDVLTASHPSYAEIRQQVKHPVSCIDCHDPKTMKLRITRPAFIEGIRTLKASQGVQNYDVNKMATEQEMRSYVCAQCHVTYYFRGAGKRLTFPWTNGLKVENIVATEDADKVSEWIHPDTGASMIKPRHPEFEMWNQGPHAAAGVTCADCHMPTMTKGKTKYTDHQINSPILKINASCKGCHDQPEAKTKAQVEQIQDNYFKLRNTALDSLMELIAAIKQAKANGATDAELAEARNLHRKAQYYIDFIMSENSMGFHAPEESLRILNEGIALSKQGLLSLKGIHPAAAHTVQANPVITASAH